MKKLLSILVSTVLVCGVVYAASVSLEWDANSEPDLLGYKAYYDTNIIDVGNKTKIIITNLVNGNTYTFTVTAYNVAGFESERSDAITYIVPTNNPTNAPTPVLNFSILKIEHEGSTNNAIEITIY